MGKRIADLSRYLLNDPESADWQTFTRILNTVSLSEAVDVLFPLLMVEVENISQQSSKILALLLDDVILERFAAPPAGADLWHGAPDWMQPAISGLDRLAQHVVEVLPNKDRDPTSIKVLCNSLGSQPGLLSALSSVVTDGQTKKLGEFLSLFDPYQSTRQIALATTYFCTENCSYCYSQSLADHFSFEMTIDSFQQVVEWMRNNGIGMLLFAGGEPFEYSQIQIAFELLRQAHLRAYVATNNLFGAESAETIEKDVIDRVSVHLWQHDRYTPELWDRFQRNLAMWRSNDISVSLRYNLIDCQYYPSEIFDICDQFNVQHISVGLAFPAKNAEYVSKRSFEHFAPLLVDLALESQSKGITTRLAKPLPWCKLQEEQVRVLKRAKMFSSVCSIHYHRGTHNILVNPDLSVFACQALPVRGKGLLSYQTTGELADDYEAKVIDLLQQPLFDTCIDCYYFVQRACQGACLAYKRVQYDPNLDHGRKPMVDADVF